MAQLLNTGNRQFYVAILFAGLLVATSLVCFSQASPGKQQAKDDQATPPPNRPEDAESVKIECGPQDLTVVSRVDPVYPAVAKKKKLSGRVIATLEINEAGQVTKVTIHKSSNKVFNDATIEALSKWQYISVPASAKPYVRYALVTVRYKWQPETK